jgi:hypothetical protein
MKSNDCSLLFREEMVFRAAGQELAAPQCAFVWYHSSITGARTRRHQ